MKSENIRLFPNMLPGLFQAVNEVLSSSTAPAIVLKSCFKHHPNWGSRDRKLVGQLFYDWIRWWRLYQYCCKGSLENPVKDPLLLVKVWSVHQDLNLPSWISITEEEKDFIHQRLIDAQEKRVLQYSIPDWLDELGSAEYSTDVWEEQLNALNQTARLVLRVNLERSQPEKLADYLEKEFQTAVTILNQEALAISKHIKIENTEAYRKGWFEIQDFNSQQVAHWLAPKVGETILDACAGAGGKTLHLAQLMQNTGQIIAEDLFPNKLKELQKRAKRNDVRIIDTQPSNKKKNADLVFDRILIDAPCTGMGVLRRNPGAKWQMGVKRLQKITALQQALLQKNAPRVRLKGVLLYVTCSLLAEENQKQTQRFLESPAGQSFQLDQEFSLLPSPSGFDGFYGARFIRTV